MKFSSVDEVQLAHSLGVVDTHAAITVRLPQGRRIKGDRGVKPGGLVQTTVGRVLFNTMLPDGHALLQHAAAVQRPGRRDLRLLRDPRPPRRRSTCWTRMNRIGFRQSTLSAA